MRPRHPLIWAVGLLVLFFVAFTFFNGIKAGAVPIHKHIYAHKELAQGREVRVLTAVKKYDVAPPYVPPVSPNPSAGPIAAPASTDAIPSYISNCESGGDYGAVNPSSGAYGKYQIMPATAAAYGCDLSTPAGQDQCAAAIYADVGASAWSCG